ncbi:hypothetical protein FSP39_019500 [Pinctada imbricata]|uniref:Uncharacterized protein n=1 Tax=Pinctada imbricata TaxID=66713 RepID=A0AA88XQ99_PINIB|nr:hypothetical protein FSP39_019500 [Pinctada imbricata]
MNYLKVWGDSMKQLRRSLSSSSNRSNGSTSEDRLLRLAVLGASKVGKSSLIKQLLKQKVDDAYEETIEDLYKYTSSKDPDLQVDILDTSGSDEYLSFRKRAMKNYDCFLLVFSLLDESSFEEMKKIRDQLYTVRRKRTSPFPLLVVGNKCDQPWRFMSKDNIESAVGELGHEYMECSARCFDDTKISFERIIDLSDTDDVFAGQAGYLGGVHDGSIFVKRIRNINGAASIEWVRLY